SSRSTRTVRSLTSSQLASSPTRSRAHGATVATLSRNDSTRPARMPSNPPLGITKAHCQWLSRLISTKIRPGSNWPMVFFGSPAEPEPQHIHGRPELAHAEASLRTDERMPAIRAHHQIGAHVALALGGHHLKPDHAAVLLDEGLGLRAHPEAERGIAPGVVG